MIVEKAAIKNEAIYSDDKTHLYLIRRVWEANQPSAAIIMLSPSAIANEIATDMSGMYILQNCCKLGIGSVSIMNLYSQLKGGIYGTNGENDLIINKSCKDCDKIILAYGTGCQTKQVAKRIGELYLLLKPYAQKLYQIASENGAGYHPLGAAVRHQWILKPFTLPQDNAG